MLKGFGVLGFFCMLEALCVILVYLEVLDAFFFVYNILTYQKKKKKNCLVYKIYFRCRRLLKSDAMVI
jgi:hypothetical protein